MTDYVMNDDDILFKEDEHISYEGEHKVFSAQFLNGKRPWKIVIADDEEEVHTMTRMVLRKFTFEERSVELISAYSGAETKHIMEEQPDISVILLDVVMESENSGLDVVRYIRESLKNPYVRIILRTGQPGQAPEDDVIRNYDINDYKSKTELTVQKLYTSIIASLRSYIDMRIIDRNRKGLEEILKQARQIFQTKELDSFMQLILETYEKILRRNNEDDSIEISGFTAILKDQKFRINCRKGYYRTDSDHALNMLSSVEFQKMVYRAEQNDDILMENHQFFGHFPVGDGYRNFIYFEKPSSFSDSDKAMLQLLTSNVSVAMDNIYLNKEIIDTQKEVLYTLGEIVEFRSKETANHVSRVAEFSYVLALEYGLSEQEASLLRMASPMHDIGKIGIPDTILTKPDKLTKEEFEIVKTHTIIGYEILKQSNRDIMKTAARVALEHHERWDGTGYPYGKKSEEIHIMSRITCIADIYDALSHKRVYKDAWSEEEVYSEMKRINGTTFEPRLVEIFFKNIDKILEIRNRYPD